MHANGIDYDINKDVIHVSVNFYNEIWVIDHSTSTSQAESNSGGNYGKGGDLIYRYGNPSAYKNTEGTTIFNNNHFPNLLDQWPNEQELPEVRVVQTYALVVGLFCYHI